MTIVTLCSLHETMHFIYEMHKDQEDWVGLPYVFHPITVMQNLHHSASVDDQHLALLHDVVEDCMERLIEKFSISVDLHINEKLDSVFIALSNYGYSDYVISGLKLLTRDCWKSLTYKNYIKNITDSDHVGAALVKYSDNCHNTDPKRRLKLSKDLLIRSLSIAENRYEPSKLILLQFLNKKEIYYV